MATPMNSKEFPRYVLPIIRKEWEQRMSAVVSPMAQFFGVETSENSEENSQGLGGLDLVGEYNSDLAEGKPGSVDYDSFDPLFEKTFVHVEYAKGTAIERKLWKDEKMGAIKRKAARLGFSFGMTIATHQSSVLNNAFSLTDTALGTGRATVGGDSVALCSASHPLNSVSPATDVFSNTGTSVLSYDNVIATLVAGQDLNGDRGNPMPAIYDILYVPTALQAKAFEITNAIGKPGGADNDANALRFMNPRPLQVVVDPYLSDSNNWFMIDSLASPMHLLWFWRERPFIYLNGSADQELVADYRGYMRQSFGWDDPRWIFGQEVA